MAYPPIELTSDQRQIIAAAKALKAEADGKILRRELLKELKATTTPLISDLKAAALSIPSSGGSAGGQALRPAIAASLKPTVRLSGQGTGVKIRASKTPQVRGFSLAGRRMNKASFRRQVFGRGVWVEQTGKPGWFDDTTKGRNDDIRRDVLKAIDDTVRMIQNRTRGS